MLVHNSKFCKTWINEDMHFIHWFRKKGCSVREEVDVTGCSPLDIQLTDFKESIVVKCYCQSEKAYNYSRG